MENKDKCGCGMSSCPNCQGGKCDSLSNCMNGHCGHGGCRWIKKLLVLFVILMAFWLGQCVGEIKGELKANYRMNRGMMYQQDGFRYKMMDNYQKDTVKDEGAPETPVKTN